MHTKHRLFNKLFLIGCFFIFQGYGQENTEWKLEKAKDGIYLYTKLSTDSKFKSIKVLTTFTNALSDIINVILDADAHYKWINNCTESKLLKVEGDSGIVFYEYYYLPWPASNRDVIIHTRIKYNSDKTSVILSSKAQPNFIAEKHGVVRIPEFEGSWKLTLQLNGIVSGEYYASVNPGGYIPAWLVNMFASNGPYDSFVNMKKLLDNKK